LCEVIDDTIIPAMASAHTTSTMRLIPRGLITRAKVSPAAAGAR
jgi:hypothetical protein